MNRTDAYRILGLREGAARQEIKRAYDERMRKYRTSDYQDEPEYAQRKMREVKYAYSILTGGTESTDKQQRVEYHEQRKDEMELEETTDSVIGNFTEKLSSAAARLKAEAKEFVPHDEGSHSHNPKKRKVGTHGTLGDMIKEKGFSAKSFKPSSMDPNLIKKLIIAFVILISVFPTIVGACVSSLTNDYIHTATPEYAEWEYASPMAVNESIDMLLDRSNSYDFDAWLGELPDSYEAVYDIVTKPEGYEDSFAQELALNLGIGDAEDAVVYLWGDESLYESSSDYENTCFLAETLMGAPTFEEVVGRQNLYRAEKIWDYGSYMQFLIDVANSQTFDVLYN